MPRTRQLDFNPLSLARKAIQNPAKAGVFLRHLLDGSKWRDYQKWRQFRSADLYLVSFPKSGRTWLRTLLGKTIHDHYGLSGDEFLYLKDFAPLDRLGLPRLVSTHDTPSHWASYEQNLSTKDLYQGKRVLFLARDMRDILVSWYYHQTRRKGQNRGSLADFLRYEGDGYGTTCLVNFYKAWHDSQHIPAAFLFIRYEDLHRQPQATLRQVVEFVGLRDVPDSVLQATIDYASFQNMRRREEQGESLAGHMTTPSESQKADPNWYFVRKGKAGGYREEMSAEDLAYIEATVDRLKAPREWLFFEG
jgi:hypothetical protein